jgi:putative transposase
MPHADTRRACEALRDQFDTRDRHLAPKAVERLGNDWERLLTGSPFPREHWRHLRTTKVVESPFAAVRLRTTATKRFKKVDAATALMWKVLQVAETFFRRLQTPELLPAVYAGATYADGIRQTAVSQPEAAA